jgi:hypothetical protein
MMSQPITRPSMEHALLVRSLTAEDRRRLKPGLPTRRFVNTVTGTSVATRDADLYTPSLGWVETTRRQVP